MKLDQIIKSFRTEDNVAFKHIYLNYGKNCISKLMKFRNCSLEDGEDLFVEALMIFREKILAGNLKELSNLENFLFKICDNNFLAKIRMEKSKEKKVSDVEFFYYKSDYVSEEEEDFHAILGQLTKKAWARLSERCKDIISYFYIDKLKMEEIARLMDFSSPDVAKTTKSRCYKQLVTFAREVMA